MNDGDAVAVIALLFAVGLALVAGAAWALGRTGIRGWPLGWRMAVGHAPVMFVLAAVGVAAMPREPEPMFADVFPAFIVVPRLPLWMLTGHMADRVVRALPVAWPQPAGRLGIVLLPLLFSVVFAAVQYGLIGMAVTRLARTRGSSPAV